MRYGNVHRSVECPELCEEVPVPLPRRRSVIVECKIDIRDDGANDEETEVRVSHRELASLKQRPHYPFPVSTESLVFLTESVLCSEIFANTPLQGC